MRNDGSFPASKRDATVFLSVALVFVLTCVAFAGYMVGSDDSVASADSGECGNGLTWKLESGTLTIECTDTTKDGKMTSTPWKDRPDAITAVIVGDNVNRIANNAFSHCTKLKTATLNSGGSSGSMFTDCSSLETVTLGKNFKENYPEDYDGCISLKEFTVEADNANYCSEDGVLYNKDKTEIVRCPLVKNGDFTIPDNVKNIQSRAFSGCTGLVSVTMPSSLETIGAWAFYGCTSLKTVKLNDGLKTISDSAFVNCSSMTQIQLPASVENISNENNDGTFFGCSSLTAIGVADSNAYFSSEDGVLYNKNKTELIQYPQAKKGTYTMPASVTGKDKFALTGCTGLDAIEVAEGNKEYTSRDGALFDKDGTTLLAYPSGHSEYVIPDGTEKIGARVFLCSPIRTLTIPSSVTEVGNNAFYDCSKLTRIVVHSEAEIALDLSVDKRTEVNCTVYSDNADVKEKVTTNWPDTVHLSYRSLSDFNGSDDGSDNTLIYVGIAAAAVIAILAFVFIRKH